MSEHTIHDDCVSKRLVEAMPWLRKYAAAITRKQLRRRLEVADVVQEICLNAWRLREAYERRSSQEFRGWLRVIGRHTVLNLSRTTLHSGQPRMLERSVSVDRRWEETAMDPAGESPHAILERRELRRLVREAIGELSSRHGEILERIYLRHDSVADVAADIGISPSGVRKREKTALRALGLKVRKRLGAESP